MPANTILEISAAEQAQLLKELRRWRSGYLLAIHIVLLSAAGKRPSAIADFLFCSRTSVYRIVAAYRSGQRGLRLASQAVAGTLEVRAGLARLPRTLLSLVRQAPRAYGWCRTRWSCQTLALELKVRTGLTISRETVRRWLHQLGYAWKRARHTARDDDPERASKLARIRHLIEQLRLGQSLYFADELDIPLLPKLGYQWMPKGTQLEVMTPGTNEKQYLAGALDFQTGQILHCTGPRKTNALFRELLARLDQRSGRQISKIYVVVDNYTIHQARAVERWLEAHPRFELVFLPGYCPKANPLERAFGDVHDHCTRNHKRKRLRDLVGDVYQHLETNGPWKYKLPELYYEPEVEAALTQLQREKSLEPAA
jgi:transposase